MSVINKMLKDLEHREQEQSGNFDSDSAVYQPKVKSKVPQILTLMLVIILVLAGTVSWLVFDTDQSKLDMSSELAQQETTESAEAPMPVVSESTPKVMNRSPSATANDEVEIEKPATTEPMLDVGETNSAKADEIPRVIESDLVPMPVATETEENTSETAPAERSPEPSSEPVTAPVSKPPPQFKIEKSSSRLSREERLAKLMKKAQASYDKGYISDAISQLNEVLALADNHVKARNLLAVAWYGRGELQQAVGILNNGLNRYPNIEAWRVTAAKIFFKENELQGAFTYLDADLASASEEFYSMKANLARQLRRFDKAEQAYANLTKLQPEKGNWWLGHAIALDSQSKSEQAIQSYQTAVAKAGISPASAKFAKERMFVLQNKLSQEP